MANKMEVLKKIINVLITENKGFDKVLSKVKFVEAGEGSCKAELLVESEMENRMGTLHGGFIATAIDSISTMALMLSSKNHHPGVSVNLNISYIKAAKDGEEVIIDARTLKAGKTLAFLTVDIINKKDGSLLAQGQHTKYIAL